MSVLVSPELSRSPPRKRLRQGSGAPKSKVPVNARQQDLGASGDEPCRACAPRSPDSLPSLIAGPSVHSVCRDFDRRPGRDGTAPPSPIQVRSDKRHGVILIVNKI